MSPAFAETGIAAFLECFDRSHIRKRAQLPRLSGKLRPTVRRLHRLKVSTFLADIQLAKEAHPAVLSALTAGARSRNPVSPHKPFTVPANVGPYSRVETELLAIILKEVSNPTKPSAPGSRWSQLFTLNTTQKKLACKLNKELEATTFNEHAAQAVYRDFLQELYFPSATTLQAALQAFSSPLAVFFAIECIGDEDGFAPVFGISCIAAKIQFLMRLRGLRCMMDARDPNVDATTWLQTTGKTFCDKYLSEDTMNPFSTIRYYMHVFTSVTLRTPRPWLIQWKEERALLIAGHEVRIDDYFRFLKQKIDELEKYVEEKVLFGSTLDDLDISTDLAGLTMKSKSGLFTNDSDITLDNPDSDRFVEFLSAALHLAPDDSTRDGNQMEIDPEKGIKWLQHINAAYCELHPLTHTTQGLPGRFTEEGLFTLDNMDVEMAHNTIGFKPTHLKTGAFKHIFRMLPQRISRLLYIMIRVVRPVELLVLLQHVVPKRKHETTLRLYSNRVFATMGHEMTSTFLSKNLGGWLKGAEGSLGLGFHMGGRMYRQFATALDRKYLGSLEVDPLATVGDHQAGRTTAVSHRHYAVEWRVDAGMARALSVQKSLDWHKMIGI
ncbi:hypothetical protein B0H12DRAFT_1151777 [Mycena haematopus]|nr:hypothetical protein B0H12DRAFT_1157646 [Mycena haematopus]KAJ7221148.1 hypothetical protein B0H12DRAFT_1151777 [Mycena haematopus]